MAIPTSSNPLAKDCSPPSPRISSWNWLFNKFNLAPREPKYASFSFSAEFADSVANVTAFCASAKLESTLVNTSN